VASASLTKGRARPPPPGVYGVPVQKSLRRAVPGIQLLLSNTAGSQGLPKTLPGQIPRRRAAGAPRPHEESRAEGPTLPCLSPSTSLAWRGPTGAAARGVSTHPSGKNTRSHEDVPNRAGVWTRPADPFASLCPVREEMEPCTDPADHIGFGDELGPCHGPVHNAQQCLIFGRAEN
jgi:hypothetical protein